MPKNEITNKFLVVQGRTLPQIEDSIQYFPDYWQSEFPLISQIGFNGIEWIYDKKSETSNPILTREGQNEMNFLSKKYNVDLENIVFDWFLVHPIIHDDEFTIKQKIDKLLSLIKSSHDSKFKRIIFPLLEKNSISNDEQFSDFIRILKNDVLQVLEENQIEFNLETSLPPEKELLLLKKVDSDLVNICFDMGNSASYGYDPIEVIQKLHNNFGSVHIKDRKFQGSTCPLGMGDVRFEQIFPQLLTVRYKNPFTFQIYRNKNSNNIEILKNSLVFIKNIIVNNNVD